MSRSEEIVQLHDEVLRFVEKMTPGELPIKLRFVAAHFNKRIRRLTNQTTELFVSGDPRLYLHLNIKTAGHYVLPRRHIDELIPLIMEGQSVDRDAAESIAVAGYFSN